MAPRILDILRLGRIHTSMATAAMPALGYLAAGGEGISGLLFVIIGGLFHHAWGFSMNEIVDLEVDRGNRDLSDKPLVSGRISLKAARNISRAFLFLSLLSFLAASLFTGGDPFYILGALMISSVFGALYNLFGKRVEMMDILIALWMTFLAGAGVLSAGPGPDLGYGVTAILVLSTLQILFNNSVEGGLKDVENDRRSNVRTMAVSTGAGFSKGVLRPGRIVIWWGRSLRIASVITGAVFSLLIMDSLGWHEWIVILTSIVGLVVFVHSLGFLKERTKINRKDLLRTFAIHEILTFGFMVLVMLPATGPVAGVVLFIVPLVWFALFNRVLFRTSLAPSV